MYKTQKEHNQEKRDKDKTQNAMYDEMERVPARKNWQATMPAFCYTELCPDPRYRRRDNGKV